MNEACVATNQDATSKAGSCKIAKKSWSFRWRLPAAQHAANSTGAAPRVRSTGSGPGAVPPLSRATGTCARAVSLEQLPPRCYPQEGARRGSPASCRCSRTDRPPRQEPASPPAASRLLASRYFQTTDSGPAENRAHTHPPLLGAAAGAANAAHRPATAEAAAPGRSRPGHPSGRRPRRPPASPAAPPSSTQTARPCAPLPPRGGPGARRRAPAHSPRSRSRQTQRSPGGGTAPPEPSRRRWGGGRRAAPNAGRDPPCPPPPPPPRARRDGAVSLRLGPPPAPRRSGSLPLGRSRGTAGEGRGRDSGRADLAGRWASGDLAGDGAMRAENRRGSERTAAFPGKAPSGGDVSSGAESSSLPLWDSRARGESTGWLRHYKPPWGYSS